MKRLLLFLTILFLLPVYGQKFVPAEGGHAKGGKGDPKPGGVNYKPYLVVNSEVFHQYPTEIAVRFRNTPPFNANITYDWEIKDENGVVVYGVSRSGYTSRTHHFRLPNDKFSFGYTVKVTVRQDFATETATKTVTAFGKPGKYFYLSDHLGNVRATIDQHGDVLSQDAYYPFGMRMPGKSYNEGDAQARYKYNGKELDEEHGLNWLAYGARYFDPEIGRWHVVDPAEEFHSGYLGIANNPIQFVDPDGRAVNHYDSDLNFLYTDWNAHPGESYMAIGGEITGYDNYTYSTYTDYRWAADNVIADGPRTLWEMWCARREIERTYGIEMPYMREPAGLEPVFIVESAVIAPVARTLSAANSTKNSTQVFKSIGAAGKNFNKVLQSGEQSLRPSTLKALNLTKEQGRRAIHALKDDLRLPNNFHGKIKGNGDYLHPSTDEWLGNLYDYLY
jgi:RHS repeat-associated protein